MQLSQLFLLQKNLAILLMDKKAHQAWKNLEGYFLSQSSIPGFIDLSILGVKASGGALAIWAISIFTMP
jgi:hypothetical protein